jgi:predicted AAA+ superfamily ATPase
MHTMINREQYLRKLRTLRDQNIIKVITGIRRSGKSTLFGQFQRELRDSGVREKNIIALNLEEMENESLLERHVLHDYVMRLADPRVRNYVFLDEIQNVPEFEKLVDSLYVKDFLDMYITGSNAYMLSSDLATFLSGRYVEIRVLPFSFREFAENYDNIPKSEMFGDFLAYGGFPEVSNLLHGGAKSEINAYLSNIYETVLTRDVKRKRAIRGEFDFENVLRFAMDNIGNLVSPNRIANYLTNGGSSVHRLTVESYLSALTDSFMLYRANRFDVRGKKLLQTLNKYYTVDLGLMRFLLGKDTSVDTGHILENVVYLELLRRNREVWVGKNNDREVDFVVRTIDGNTEYYQVAETMLGEATRVRELAPLENIRDHYQKFVLTLDSGDYTHRGIRQLNMIDWLLG